MSLKSVFIALSSVIGADGKVEPAEMSELLRAAAHEGLTKDDLRAIESASHEPLDPSTLDDGERRFVYGIAYWLARVDGEMTEAEDKVITNIGKQLGIPDADRMAAEGLVDEIAASGSNRPDRFDIGALRKRLAR